MVCKKKEIILSIQNILPEKGNTSSACIIPHLVDIDDIGGLVTLIK